MKRLIFISLCFFSTITNGQWNWQNPKPQGNYLNSLWVVNENSFVSVGQNGIYIKTTDSGANWEVKNIYNGSYNCQLTDIYQIGDNVEFAIGYDDFETGVLLKTTNEGTTWVDVTDSSMPPLFSIFFVNQDTGWVIGNDLTSYNGVLYKTTNGGQTWFLQYSGLMNQFLYGIGFANSNIGFISGSNGLILKTTDGGINWNSQTSHTSTSLGSISIIDENIALIVDYSGAILKTTDSGLNWNIMISPIAAFSKMHFCDQNNGWVIGNNGTIYKTTDGGNNWFNLLELTGMTLNGICFNDPNTGYIVGEDDILKSTDGGTSWINLTKHLGGEGFSTILNDIFFINALTGWTVGYKYGQNNIYYSKIFKTSDGGNSWAEQSIDDSSQINSIFFFDQNFGWLSTSDWNGSSRKIYKTTNGGGNWFYINSINNCKQLYFNSQTNGWALADGKIYKTTNGGENWTEIQINMINSMKMFFIDDLNGWIAGSDGSQNGYLFKTTNGGTDWEPVNIGVTSNLNSIYFLNENLGWTVGDNGTIIKTTDKGNTWINKNSETTNPLFSICMTDSNKGWAVGSYKTILRTTNGGENWEKELSPWSDHYWKITFVDQNSGWILGNSGVILKTTNGGINFVQENKNKYLDEYLLKQNYPNPFNPSTIINYVLKDEALVKIKVFDILGSVVAELVNETKAAGEHSIVFKKDNLPSGVYFYSLQVNGYTNSKKMLLLK